MGCDSTDHRSQRLKQASWQKSSIFEAKMNLFDKKSVKKIFMHYLFEDPFFIHCFFYMNWCNLIKRVNWNHFLFLKINGYLYPWRVSLPLKKTPWYIMLSEGNAAHFLWIVMAVWRTVLNIWTCWVRLDSQLQIVMADGALKFEKSDPNGHYSMQRAVTPYHITQQNCLHRAWGP
jgi:hypothetical protein